MKKKKDYILSEQLINALPLDEWFSFETLEVDMTKARFNARLSEWPRHLLRKRKKGFTAEFRLCTYNKNALINLTEPKTAGVKKGAATRNKKMQPHNLSLEDICRNLFEGVRVTEKQMKVIN